MEPLIRDGDWVEVRSGKPVRGSVVLARGGSGQLVCHRVLARRGEGLLLAGDRSLAVEALAAERVLGVVRGVERGGAIHRLGGWWMRGLDRSLAGLHQLSWRWRGRPAGRYFEALRRLALSSSNRLGASIRRRPASSR